MRPALTSTAAIAARSTAHQSRVIRIVVALIAY
jgi:hypothetical protein